MKSTINERVKLLSDTLYDGNVSAFARSIDVKRNALQDVIGPKQVKPGYDTLSAIAEKSTVDLDWLLTGRGEMLRDCEGSQYKTDMPIRESDDNIYHYSKTYDGFLNIFKLKIKPRYAKEDWSYLFGEEIQYKDLDIPKAFKSPMFCLCDIPLERHHRHMTEYGKYGIGFTKEWAVKNKLNVVHYIHKESEVAKYFCELLHVLFNLHDEEWMKKQSFYTEKKDNTFDGIIDDIYYALSFILFSCKPYQSIDGTKRYYDEKEWRWMPMYNEISHAIKSDKNGNFDKDEINRKHYEFDSNSKIGLNFNIDDICSIILENESDREKFLKDIREIKNPDGSLIYPIEKIKPLIKIYNTMNNSDNITGDSDNSGDKTVVGNENIGNNVNIHGNNNQLNPNDCRMLLKIISEKELIIKEKDAQIEHCNETFHKELDKFHEVQLEKDRYIEKILEKCYNRNEQTMARFDKVVEQNAKKDDDLRKAAEDIRKLNETIHKLQQEINRLKGNNSQNN